MKVTGKFLLPLLCLLVVIACIYGSEDAERLPYIVYLGEVPNSRPMGMDAHHSLLQTAIGDEQTARESLIHSYVKSFNAFAARLRPEEAEKLSGTDGVVSVFPSTISKLHTTRSWDFLGLTQAAERKLGTEGNVVVGLLDTGLYPHLHSFNAEGLGPPPPKWKGKCINTGNFTGCNNKIIGAKYFHLSGTVTPPDQTSPIDTIGHGTHTSSTVVGAVVDHANLYGLAEGMARGGVPSARIAMYKVCWQTGCTDMDILAGFDEAIADGVDVISVSLGGATDTYFTDPVAIGAFHAMKKGIFTSCSAGNSGPQLGSAENVAPWIMTVAASSNNRQFRTKVQLGDNQVLTGISINTFPAAKRSFPLISGVAASIPGGSNGAVGCIEGFLDKKKAAGKILYCQYNADDSGAKSSGGLGVISENDGSSMDIAFAQTLPSATIDPTAGEKLVAFMNSTRNPEAVIYKSYAVNVSDPFIASFSSRGPNSLSLNILKPDISAPGLNILAAYSPLTTLTGDPTDDRVVNYNVLSGTSMACPHVTAVAAYVKSFHPNWSPAAIKSAIMTTAKEMVMKNAPEAEFAYGAGLIDPVRAVDPGLVYDTNYMSYISFLCKEGYYGSMIGNIVGSNPVNCSTIPPARGSDGLNYPSMQLQVNSSNHTITAIFHRVVTNVGPVNSVYNSTVRAPKGFSITVMPTTLVFDHLHRKRSFKVVVKSEATGDNPVSSASLVWSDLNHTVRSPIVIHRVPDQ